MKCFNCSKLLHNIVTIRVTTIGTAEFPYSMALWKLQLPWTNCWSPGSTATSFVFSTEGHQSRQITAERSSGVCRFMSGGQSASGFHIPVRSQDSLPG